MKASSPFTRAHVERLLSTRNSAGSWRTQGKAALRLAPQSILLTLQV